MIWYLQFVFDSRTPTVDWAHNTIVLMYAVNSRSRRWYGVWGVGVGCEVSGVRCGVWGAGVVCVGEGRVRGRVRIGAGGEGVGS